MPVLLSNEELEQVFVAQADSSTLVKAKFASWIAIDTIDEKWDGYVSPLESTGVEDVIGVYQQAHDRFEQGGK